MTFDIRKISVVGGHKKGMLAHRRGRARRRQAPYLYCYCRPFHFGPRRTIDEFINEYNTRVKMRTHAAGRRRSRHTPFISGGAAGQLRRHFEHYDITTMLIITADEGLRHAFRCLVDDMPTLPV